jgi:hypothetical protein
MKKEEARHMNSNTHEIFSTKTLRNIHKARIPMIKPFRLLSMLILALGIAGCSGVHTGVVIQPDNIAAYKEITLLPPDVFSREETPDAVAINQELKELATKELQALMNSKQITVSDNGKATVECNIKVDYGNRAMRAMVGYGAGTGYVKVRIELKDSNGVTRYATKSEAELSAGLIGGDMSEVARDAVRTAVKDFGTKL